MKRPACDRAFTLVEILVSIAVLVIVVALAGQMTSATLATVKHSTEALDDSESVRAATMLLRDELAGLTAVSRKNRFLNLRLIEDEKGVVLFFAVPRAQTANLARMGFVTHIAYVWDRQTRVFGRAEYHSSREPDAVNATASSPESTNTAANLERLEKITPAYQGADPYSWTLQGFWAERFEEALRNPLLTNVAEWKVECFRSALIDEEDPKENVWEQADALPTVIRFTFVTNAKRSVIAKETAEERKVKKTVGRYYTSIVPIPGAEVTP